VIRKLVQVAALLLATNLTTFPARPQAPAGRPVGRLTGAVVDINEARMAGASVIITGGGVTRTINTDEEGMYRIELPPGIYRLRVESTGFCPARRAAIYVRLSTVTTFNFSLIPCALSNDLTIADGRYEGEVDRYRDPFKEEVFPLTRSAGAPLELLVRYGRRREVQNVIEYQGTTVSYDEYADNPAGSVRRSRYLGATISYNSLMIRGDRVRLDPRTLLLEAEGNVIVDDVKRHARVRRAVVDLRAGEPRLELTQ
jgi:hypothetical protein